MYGLCQGPDASPMILSNQSMVYLQDPQQSRLRAASADRDRFVPLELLLHFQEPQQLKVSQLQLASQ